MDTSFARVVAQYLGFFRAYAGRRVYWFILLTILASNAEAIGIALFLPLFTQDLTTNHDLLSRTIVSVLRLLHLPITTAAALPLIIVVFFLRGGLQFAAGAYQYIVSAEMTKQLRQHLVESLSQADYRYILSTNAGTLTNVVATEVTRATSAFTYFSRLFPSIVNIVVFFVIVTIVSWHMTVVMFVAAVVILVLFRAPSRWTKYYSRRTTDENVVLTRLTIQNVQSFKYLAATQTFAPLNRAIFASTERLAQAVRRIGVLYSMTTGLSQPLMVLLLAGIMYWHTVFVGPSLGAILVLLLYLYRITAEVFNVQTIWQDVCGFMGGLDAVRATLSDVSEQREVSGAAPFAGLQTAIELRNVSFAFDEQPVLSDVSLQIARHTTVALVGESGAGKSTIVDLITGLLKPNAGAVMVDGKSLVDIDLSQFRKRIGYVPQESIVFDDTVANNISMWSCSSRDPECLRRIRDAARAASCDDFIEAMPSGYESLIGERGVKLSGGQRQRLAIAKELFKQPDVLILDEATSALDSDSERLIQTSIDGLKGRLTAVIIAHRLSTVRLCDQIFVLHEGRVAEAGTFAELFARRDSRFRRLCDLQNLD